jgi:hypothetical protein
MYTGKLDSFKFVPHRFASHSVTEPTQLGKRGCGRTDTAALELIRPGYYQF